MKNQNRIKYRSLATLGLNLGLSRKELNRLLNKTMGKNEQIGSSLGPPTYNGGFYGVISINDFRNCVDTE